MPKDGEGYFEFISLGALKQMARPVFGRRAIYFSREELTTGKTRLEGMKLFYLKEALDEF